MFVTVHLIWRYDEKVAVVRLSVEIDIDIVTGLAPWESVRLHLCPSLSHEIFRGLDLILLAVEAPVPFASKLAESLRR